MTRRMSTVGFAWHERFLRLSVLALALGSTVLAFQTKGWSSSTWSSTEIQRSKVLLFASAEQPSEEPTGEVLLDLLGLLGPQSSCDTTRMSGTDLAYIGDVIFELFVRSRYVWPPKRTADLQKTVVECVRAENQSALLAALKSDFPLSTEEQKVLKRGRNAVTRSRNRRDPATYQDSTAFECLLAMPSFLRMTIAKLTISHPVGYLFIADKKRCHDLLIWLESQLKAT